MIQPEGFTRSPQHSVRESEKGKKGKCYIGKIMPTCIE